MSLKSEVEKQFEKQVKLVRLDWGAEYYHGYTESCQAPYTFTKFL